MSGKQIGKEVFMRGDNVVWTIVGILAIVALLIFIIAALG
jgi:hypothetical protein